MEIGLFQLENLILSRVAFCLLDLRAQPTSIEHPETIRKILSQAVPVDPNRVEEHLQKTNHNREIPIVLICQDGRLSTKVGEQLESLGYQQVYIVERGVEGLLADLAESE